MVDALFNICDQTLSRLRVGGELRPLLHAALATMLMYYEDRYEGKEMHSVLALMIDAYSVIAPVGANASTKQAKLMEWGAAIRLKVMLPLGREPVSLPQRSAAQSALLRSSLCGDSSTSTTCT